MRTIAFVVLAMVGEACTACQPKGDPDEVFIAGGGFTMGHEPMGLYPYCEGSTEPCTPSICSQQTSPCNSFAPRHSVALEPYFIDKLEVTIGQYRACVEDGFCSEPRFGTSYFDLKARYSDPAAYSEYPLVGARWNEAQRYCQWRGRRLPTEAEWELAARGPAGRDYPWGNKAPTCDSLPEACPPRAATGAIVDRMRPVGTTASDATPEGVMDLAGNASELVADFYDARYYAVAPERNPTGPSTLTNVPVDSDEHRVVRGGWFDWEPKDWPAENTVPAWARTSSRSTEGFRCARSLARAGIAPKYTAIAWRRTR